MKVPKDISDTWCIFESAYKENLLFLFNSPMYTSNKGYNTVSKTSNYDLTNCFHGYLYDLMRCLDF